jgi:hypothetical protein
MAVYTYANRPAEAEPKPVGVQVVSVAKPVMQQVRVVHPVVRQVAVTQAIRMPSVPIEGAQGLTRAARNLADYISTNYPGVRSIGGVRADNLPDHPSGHAIDIMVFGNTALGNQICADVLSQAQRFGVKYVIWQETYRTPRGTKMWMSNRGSVTANHYDHVHVTVY